MPFSPNNIQAGVAFLAPSTPKSDMTPHLWVIISDPRADRNQIVIVNFTSYRQDKDQACRIRVGEHPFVRKDTLIHFPAAKMVSATRLQTLHASGEINMQDALSGDLLEKIRLAVPNSRIDIGVYEFLVSQGVILPF